MRPDTMMHGCHLLLMHAFTTAILRDGKGLHVGDQAVMCLPAPMHASLANTAQPVIAGLSWQPAPWLRAPCSLELQACMVPSWRPAYPGCHAAVQRAAVTPQRCAAMAGREPIGGEWLCCKLALIGVCAHCVMLLTAPQR